MADGWFAQNAPTNTGVTGGRLGPAVPVSTLPPNYHLPGGPNLNPQPSTTMGQPPTYAQGPGGISNPPQYQGPPTQGGSLEQMPMIGGQGGGDYQSEFMSAVQQLGIAPQQLRGNPDLMNKVTDFLNQKYPGQNWGNGGTRAGDWFSVNGQGFDVLPAGDRNYQWLSDPANSTAGAGGGNLPGGYYTGLQYGGGQYPLASAGGPGLATPWTTPFNAPTDITEQNDPGFQARMKMGTDAIQRSAAARGTLLTGGLMKGLDRYAQDYASNEYNNVYNRALGQYQMAYDIFNNNGNTLFNRLGSLSSIGENAAAGVGNIQQGVGNANAAASINQGNIWGNVANQAGNLGQIAYLNSALAPKTPTPANYTTGYNPSSYQGQNVPGDG